MAAGVWTQQGNKLKAACILMSSGSRTASLSANGDRIVAIGICRDSNHNPGRALWSWTRIGEGWTPQSTLMVGWEGTGSGIPNSLAVSADGNTAIIGAVNDNKGIGATWVLTEIGTPSRRRAVEP